MVTAATGGGAVSLFPRPQGATAGQPGSRGDVPAHRGHAGGGTPWLVTISHERDAFLRLTDDGAAPLLATMPALAPTRERHPMDPSVR